MFRRVAICLLLISFAVPASAACPSASFFRGKKYSGAGRVFLTTDGPSLGEPIVVQETFNQNLTGSSSLTSSGVTFGRLSPEGLGTITEWVLVDRARCKFSFTSSDGSSGAAFVSRSGAQIDFYGSDGEPGPFHYSATMHLQ